MINNKKEIRKFIELNRSDLIASDIDAPFEDIGLEMFKSSSLSVEEMHEAEVISFIDCNVRILKSRYQ